LSPRRKKRRVGTLRLIIDLGVVYTGLLQHYKPLLSKREAWAPVQG
jgi:hypothetical protein